MRKVIVSEFLTLDGIMESPNKWSLEYWCSDIAKFKFGELLSSDALLLGRITYEGFAAAWPDMTAEGEFADMMNGNKKYVVSTTLGHADWNNSHIINKDIYKEIEKLKGLEGKDILVAGSSDLVNSLLQNKLIDEIQLLVYPVVYGKGKKLFQEGNMTKLELLESRSFETGVVLLRYKVI
jgi:dihydrofolate reductase